MAAAFLIARNRGLDEFASQVGFFVVLNLVFTFSIPEHQHRRHLGGLIGGGARRAADQRARARPEPQLERPRGDRARRPLRGRRRGGADRGRLERAGRDRLRRAQRPAELSSKTSSCPMPRGSGARSGCRRWASSSTPSTSRGPGPREGRGGIDRDHPPGAQRAQPLALGTGLRRRLLDVEAAGHHHRDLRGRRGHRLPGDDLRLLARLPEDVLAPGAGDHLRDPVAAGEDRIEPLERRDPRAGRPGHGLVDRRQPGAELGEQPARRAGARPRPRRAGRGPRAPRRGSRGQARAPPGRRGGRPATAQTSS